MNGWTLYAVCRHIRTITQASALIMRLEIYYQRAFRREDSIHERRLERNILPGANHVRKQPGGNSHGNKDTEVPPVGNLEFLNVCPLLFE
jgi:hypothetical protein